MAPARSNVRKVAGTGAARDKQDLTLYVGEPAVWPSSSPFGINFMRRYRIAVIPGDGIGKEVIPAGLEVLKAIAERDGEVEWSFDQFDWGSDYYRETGLMMPTDGREQIKDHDAIYFGAVGSPRGARSHQPLGPETRDLPAVRPIRQRPSGSRLAGDREPTTPRERARARLGYRAGEFGGRIRRRRRARPSRPAAGSRNRRLDHDPRWGGTHLSLRLRARPGAPAQIAHHRHQIERAAARHGDVG